MKPLLTTRNLLLACSIALITGCGGANAAGSASNSTGILAGTVTLQPLTVAETETLLFVREEEKMARDVYLTLYGKWGQLIFQNIATRSEQQHMDTMKLLVDSLGLVDTVVSDAVGDFTDLTIDGLYDQLVARGSTSVTEGLAVGAFIEEFDINDLQEAIDEAKDGSNQLPLVQAYTNLMCGSRNHLRSFVSQIEMSGVNYQAQVMPQATVDLIVDSPMEQCGQ